MNIEVQRLLNVPRRVAWPNLWGWGLFCLAFIQFLLLYTIQDVRSSTAFAIYWIYPIGIAGACVLTVYGALRQPVKQHRYAWMLQSLSCLFGIVRVSISLLYMQRGLVFDTLPSLLLYIGMYAGSLGAVAIYLPRRAWWLGNIPRVLMDSAVIGVSVLVMLASFMPFIGRFWYANRTPDLITIGANITMLFAVFIVSVRYRRNGGSLLSFGVLSILCLICETSFVQRCKR